MKPGSVEDHFFASTELIMLKDEIKIYKHLPDQGAREKFIEEFWEKRDPTPETEINENRIEFEHRVDFVDRLFRERVGKGRGWESDRGKVYLLLGEPDERSTQHITIYDRFGLPKQALAEVWVYNYHRVYLEFVDADDMGVYRLRIWPVELLSAIERAKFTIQSPGKTAPAIEFKTIVNKNEIKLHIPIKSVSFSETAEGMKARFKVTLFIYKDYEKISQKEETMEVAGRKEELLKREDIELVLPLDLPSPGKYLLDIVVEEMASGAKYRDLIKYKFK